MINLVNSLMERLVSSLSKCLLLVLVIGITLLTSIAILTIHVLRTREVSKPPIKEAEEELIRDVVARYVKYLMIRERSR